MCYTVFKVYSQQGFAFLALAALADSFASTEPTRNRQVGGG